MLNLDKCLNEISECYQFKNPYNLKYINKQLRIDSFKSWNKPVSITDLAEAGFYWNGIGDEVICFHCGVGLKNWEESDDPWEQHSCWGKNCLYLQLKKGNSFIETAYNKMLAVYDKENIKTQNLNTINDKALVGK